LLHGAAESGHKEKSSDAGNIPAFFVIIPSRYTRHTLTIKGKSMHILHVFLHVKPEYVEAFKAATVENARNSVQEAGIVRFDVIQQADDPTRFVLAEVYRSNDARAQHRETAHFLMWRDTVADMLVTPLTRTEYVNIFPDIEC
jgi:(4S)-4-hydroxy-5-phosphonooxypentane-2,3-dione isomerase